MENDNKKDEVKKEDIKKVDKKKPEKKKKEKKKLIPFDKIDITTATEDEIIRSGIKHNTKKDTTCYLILVLIVALAVTPPVLRFIMPRPKTKEEREIVYQKITCYKTTIRDNYELATTLTSNYRDGEVSDVEFAFKYFKRNEQAKDGYTFVEIEEIENIDLKGVTSKRDGANYIFDIDFENHPELKDHEVLKDYAYFSTAEVNWLSNEKGYSCTTDSETKLEVVDIETGKKIE